MTMMAMAWIITNYASLLEAFQGAFDTTLSKDEITSLIKYQIQENPQWKFESYQLTGEGDQLFSPELGSTAYVTLVDPTSITMAHDKIEAVLHGKSADSITEPVSDFTSNEGYVPSSSSSDGKYKIFIMIHTQVFKVIQIIRKTIRITIHRITISL